MHKACALGVPENIIVFNENRAIFAIVFYWGHPKCSSVYRDRTTTVKVLWLRCGCEPRKLSEQ